MDHAAQEWEEVKRRLEHLEALVERKTTPVRIEKVEYRIENLLVDKIDGGVLDLGVHLAREEDPFLAGEGEQESAASPFFPLQEVQGEIAAFRHRLERLETLLATYEQWIRQLAQKVADLEDLLR